jgi:hypothetical protein
MREEEQNHQEESQEKIVLSDHDALLLPYPLAESAWHFEDGSDVTKGTLRGDGGHTRLPDTVS